MKLKCQPADFQVEELTSRQPLSGNFALYRLMKRSLGTLEAVDEIVSHWQLRRDSLSFGGLKDRHAITLQHLTIDNGPRENFCGELLELEYLGQTSTPFTPHDISGNRFELVMRDLSYAECEFADRALESLSVTGLPNYFDDQRFGSVGQSGEFIAVPWCLGDYERALWLALAEPHDDDDPGERDQKRILQKNWGNWPVCLRLLRRSYRHSLVLFLAGKRNKGTNPPSQSSANATEGDVVPAVTDFRGGVARMKADLRGLYLAAFQSHLWNRMLATYLRQSCQSSELFDVPLQMGPVPFLRRLSAKQLEQFSTTLLPLPSARQNLTEGPICTLTENVVREFGLEIRQLRVAYPRGNFFPKGERPILLQPTHLESEFDADQLYPGKHRLALRFELPRGSYATILVKRLTLPAHSN